MATLNPTSPEAEAELTEGFNVEKALNTKGFAEFLAKFSDAKEGDISPEDMQERFEVYEAVEGVSKAVKEIYSKEISAELGIALSEKDISCVDEYLNNLAVESPKEVMDMQERIDTYNRLPEEIAQAQSDIDNLAINGGFEARAKEMHDMDQILQTADKASNTWGKVKMNAGLLWGAFTGNYGESQDISNARKIAGLYGGPLTTEGIAKRRAQISTEAAAQQQKYQELKSEKEADLGKLKGSLANTRNALFAHEEMTKKVVKIATLKLGNTVNKIAEQKGLDSFAKAYDKLVESKVGKETGIEYIAEGDEERIVNSLNKAAEQRVTDAVAAAFKKVQPNKADQFLGLQNSLSEVLSVKKLGTKNEQETRDSIVTILTEILVVLDPADPTTVLKKILMKQLITKFSATPITA